jgi:predicted small lipoprotein YifL
MGKNRVYFFHILIITLLLAGMAGCGYKKPPYYPSKSETGMNG